MLSTYRILISGYRRPYSSVLVSSKYVANADIVCFTLY